MTAEPRRVRAFLACAIEKAEAVKLGAALEPLRAIYSGRAYRWVPEANYHVTLRFFGQIPRESIAAIGELIKPIANASAPIHGVATPPRPLPSARSPRVIVLPIASDGRLEQLAAQCHAALVGGFGTADKPFKAHLTIVRCERGARFVEPMEFEYPLELTRLALFESTSAKGHPNYTPLYQYRLGG